LRAIVPITELGVILSQQYLPQDWGVVLLDGDKPIVARHPLVLRKTSKDETTAPPASESPNKQQNNGGELIEIALENVGTWGWRVAVSVPETAFVRPLRLLLLQFGLAGLVCLLASIFASFWLARRLSHDINAWPRLRALWPPGIPASTKGRSSGNGRGPRLPAGGQGTGRASPDRSADRHAGPGPVLGLAGELERQSQSDMNLGLAVMFIDLDGFKQVNDRYGHDRGDAVLGAVAGIIRESVRDTDVVGRLGGDEFAVCLTARRGHLIPAASSIAERIVGKVREIGYGIGCSIGVSVCEICSPDLARALTLADQAMYEAKRLGKDRYVIHEDTTA
jgi:diguanylate cyclase (GGDEF)-like protein